MANLPSIPAISSKIPTEVSALLRPMREILNAFTAGDHQVAKLKDLRALGVSLPGVPGSGSDIGAQPPKPTGLTLSGALATIILSWDASSFAKLSHTEIWRAPTNDFSLAQLVGRSDGRIYVDNVGGAAVRFYWVRYVSQANVVGPFNAQVGTRGETGADPAYLLSLLTGKIQQSQLYADLGSKIDLITAPASTPGSVTQRISAGLTQEKQERVDGDTALTEWAQYLSAATATSLAANHVAYTAQVTADTAVSQRIESLVAQTAAGLKAAIVSEQTVRATADSATATELKQLQAIVSDPSTGLVAKYAAVKILADASVTALGKVQAKYTVNIDVDGVAGGFGVIGSSDGLVSTIDFGVRASTFFVAGPSGTGIAPSTPFIMRTAASVINGVNVPAGAYIADAFIANGTITNAKIGNAAIDDAKIANLNAGKITAGDIAATRMQANIVTALIGKFSTLSALTASLGQIEINAGGYLRTQGVSSYTAGAGLWMGQVDGVYKFRVGNPMGNYMQWDGSSLTIIGSGQFSGKLMGASGDFSGNLNATSGTLGVITAGLLRNTANTSYMNLNASGAEPFLSIGNGAIILRANGSGQFSRELISEPNVITRGVTGVNVGWVGYVGGEYRPFTVYIDTSVSYPDGWYDAPSIAYMATATIATGKSNNGGINGFTQAEIVSGDGLGNLNAYPIDNRIYIKFTWTPTTGTGQILPESIKWKLVRV